MTNALNWLLLRGLAREARHWGDFPKILESRLPGTQTFCVDLPGAGTEHERMPSPSVESIMEDTRARFLEAKRPGRWAILGQSLGGMVAMLWAQRYPEDFERVAVLNTSAANVAGPHHRFGLGALPGGLRSLAARDLETRESFIFDITCTDTTKRTETVASWVQYARERPVRRRALMRQLLAASRVMAPERLDVPILVLASSKDKVASPICSMRLAQRLEAPLHVHPTAGHDLGHDVPHWVADRIGEWIQQGELSEHPAVA